MSAPRRPLLLLAVLALLGAIDGLYLTLVHLDYEVGAVGLAAACHKFSSTGCAVTAGRFGDVAGIPVATIGFAGALVTAVVATVAWRRRDRWDDPYRSAAVLLAYVSVLASIAMAVLSFVEGAYCPFCLLWYGINAALGWAAWRSRDAHLGIRDMLDDALGTPALVAAGIFGAVLFSTMKYYDHRRTVLEQQRFDALVPALVREFQAKPAVLIVIADDAASRGPADAEVTIIEYGDFECPYCRRLWASVEHYAETSGRRVRVAFAHYPLDSSCNPDVDKLHPNACAAAVAGECARRQGKFFEYGQQMFDHQADLDRDDLLAYAEAVGLDRSAFTTCLDDPTAIARVRADVTRGAALNITGTPTFFINGRRWTGVLSPDELAAVVEGLLTPP